MFANANIRLIIDIAKELFYFLVISVTGYPTAALVDNGNVMVLVIVVNKRRDLSIP